MFKWKKTAALLAAAALACSMTGCGESTAYAMTIDGMDVNAGVYIYYSYAAFNELSSTLTSEDSELDMENDKAVKALTMDGVSTETWLRNKAMEYCQEYVAIEQKFEELKLELDADSQKEINTTVDAFWESNSENFENNGISKDSVKKVLENTYKANEVFLYYYNVDGEEGVTEDELKEYYIDNNARVRYIAFNMTDGSGEALDDAGKADLKKMVEDYLKQLDGLKKDEEIDAEMDAIQTDYNAYVTSISEEAAAATATSPTDEEGNEIPAATTTTEATTTTAAATTTTAAEPDADAENTTVAGDSEEAETTASDETSDETTTEAAESADDTEAGTTTTTSPYANERIIAKVTTDDADDSEEDPVYTPCKAVYDFAFGDAEMGVPQLVEDENAYYIVVRRDIQERMTEEDLWTEDQILAQVSNKYYDAYEDLRDGWCDSQNVQENARAIKRYDPFKIEMSSNSEA